MEFKHFSIRNFTLSTAHFDRLDRKQLGLLSLSLCFWGKDKCWSISGTIFSEFWMVSTSEDLQWRNWSVRDVRPRHHSVLRLLGCREGSTVGFKGEIWKAESLFQEQGLKRRTDAATATLNEPHEGSGTFQWKERLYKHRWTKGCNYTSSSCLQRRTASLCVYKSSHNFVLFLIYCFLKCA